MHVVVYCPNTGDTFLERELAGDEVMDARTFADEVADQYGTEIDDSDGFIPNCSGDIRVEFREDPTNPLHIWSGESFYLKAE